MQAIQLLLMEAQKNTRRKRRDPESRDFTCSCGRTYLSYAAAYTHVKNKHHLDKKYLDDIGKPTREKLPRGRPKEKKEVYATKETQELLIIEETILKMHQSLQAKFQKMILEGNETISNQDLEESFSQMLATVNRGNRLSIEETRVQDFKFINDLTKHFNLEISVRARFVVLVLSDSYQKWKESSEWQKSGIVKDLNRLDLWRGVNEINGMIMHAYLRWRELNGQVM